MKHFAWTQFKITVPVRVFIGPESGILKCSLKAGLGSLMLGETPDDMIFADIAHLHTPNIETGSWMCPITKYNPYTCHANHWDLLTQPRAPTVQ